MITLSYLACHTKLALLSGDHLEARPFLSLLTQNGQDKLNQPNFGNCFLWYQINILSLLCLVFAFFEQLFHWTCTFVSNLESEEDMFWLSKHKRIFRFYFSNVQNQNQLAKQCDMTDRCYEGPFWEMIRMAPGSVTMTTKIKLMRMTKSLMSTSIGRFYCLTFQRGAPKNKGFPKPFKLRKFQSKVQ